MIIEKEIQITQDDYNEYQKYVLSRMSKYQRNNLSFILFIMPAIFILFSNQYTYNSTIRFMGLMITISFFVYYIFSLMRSRSKGRMELLGKEFTNKDETKNIRITDTDYTEKSEYFTGTYIHKWITEIQESEKCMFIIGNRGSAYIIPKRYLNADDIFFIKSLIK